jgi:Amt family ammonium transporter
MSAGILYLIDKVMGLRVSADDEQIGLDLALHGERIE